MPASAHLDHEQLVTRCLVCGSCPPSGQRNRDRLVVDPRAVGALDPERKL
jgi:hypothetical protein